MTNLLQTAGLLLLLVAGAHCYGYNDDNFDGFPRISTLSTPEDGACMITLQSNTTPNAIFFNQTQQLMNNCVNSNITFNSFFAEDCGCDCESESDNEIVFYPIGAVPNVTYPITANLTIADIQRQNGTGCVYLPQNFKPGYDKYFCAIRFSMVDIYLEFYGNHNNVINLTNTTNTTINTTDANTTNTTTITNITNSTNLTNLTLANVNDEYNLIPNYANRHILDNAYNHVDRNLSFPNITAWLSESCNATMDDQIRNLSSTVYINAANLTVLRANWSLSYTLTKRRDAVNASDYLVRASPSNDSLFDDSDGPCWALPITFEDLLTNTTNDTNSSYCDGEGCQISFIVDNYDPAVYGSGAVYVIQTTGIVVNVTNATNTTVTVTTVNETNSTGRRLVDFNMDAADADGNALAMSAMTTAFNVCLLLVSMMYLLL